VFQKGVLGPGCASIIGIVGLGRRRGRNISRIAALEMFIEKCIPISSKEEGQAFPYGFTEGLRFRKRPQNKAIIEV
jgi:hypothetical protein